MGLTVETRQERETAIACLVGEIDGKTAPEAERTLQPLVEGAERIVLEMGGVTFCSSAGLRTLLLLYRIATAREAGIALVGLSEEIRDTMSMTGFLDFFVVTDTLDEAFAALGVEC